MLKRVAILAVASMLCTASTSRAASIGWVASGGPNDFDNIAITFPGFTASQLTDVTGGGYIHDNGDSTVTFTLDLRLNSVWTTVWSTTGTGNSDLLLGSLVSTPILFASATVDGIRLTDNPAVGNGYHGMGGSYLQAGDTTFHFDNLQATAVPEPASLLLLGSGIAGIAAKVRRRQKQAVQQV